MKHVRILFLVIAAMLFSQKAMAQCTFRNTAFKSGEFLTYNLYYNWKFVWVKAGTASMYTVQSKRNGKEAYRASLITRGNNKVDNWFVLRDTLLCYNTLNLAPLYFRRVLARATDTPSMRYSTTIQMAKCTSSSIASPTRAKTNGKIALSTIASTIC